MKIVFDLDNTLTDEFGASMRPGMLVFLDKLKSDGHTLILWTNSTKDRAKIIIYEHGLKKYFEKCIFREDYDRENKGLMKNIMNENADFIIDDDPDEIEYNRKNRKHGYKITPYRKGKPADPGEYEKIYKAMKKK